MAAQPGLSARIDVDTRFITSPTTLKLAVMVLGVVSVLASIVALAVLDRRSGRRVPRGLAAFLSGRASVTWITDIGVIGTLLLWHVIGAISSDDGYNLAIARVSADAGYTANYYRFFGATEAPFDWYQSVLAQHGVDQHRRGVDAAARHRGGDRDLADHQPLRAAPARSAARRSTGSRC